ncbi:hypothetical protein EJ02DRAFT_307570, partial [Clathrospora elynae]
WDLQLVELQSAIVVPTTASKAATIATAEEDDSEEEDMGRLDARFVDNFEGINWNKLQQYCKPMRTLKGKKSWVFNYGYRVALQRSAEQVADKQERTFFVCHWCHQNTASSGIVEFSTATSSAAKHLGLDRRGHYLSKHGKKVAMLPGGQSTIETAMRKGVAISQEVANELGNFNVQGFRLAAMLWLVENNHPLREFESKSFRKMLQYANPAAEDALW